ncbi:Glycosyltransferase family 61 protein [Trifolium repens]|nr:Glycosyltransferase family 61 protein [Trifolium repens]
MIYNTIFAKSFSRYEQKKLAYGAFVGILLIVLSLCTVFKPYLDPIYDLNLKLSIGVDTKMLMVTDTSGSGSRKIAKDERIVPKNPVNATRISPQMAKVEDNTTKPLINKTGITLTKAEVEKLETRKVEEEQPLCVSEARTEYCQTQGDIRVHGKSSSVYIVSHKTNSFAENASWSIRPYARKTDAYAMSSVRKWSVQTVKGSQQVSQCTKNHSIPAVVFSTAGYTGNHFHEFSDIIIPLFLTCAQFNGQVQLIITDKKPWWIVKHQAFIKKLSNYEIMDIDRNDEVHCFPKVIVGLKRYHKELSIDPQKYSYSIKDFRDFLRSSYSLNRVNAIKIRDTGNQSMKPRLLILSRKSSRSFTNTNQIAKMAKGLGFKVIVMEAGRNMGNIADVVNSCDVLMGVHGAGLTNILFLPENAIFIQVVPCGGMQVEWLATNDFAKPSEDMKIKYLEYKITLEESTLKQQYPLDHMVIKDPSSIVKQGWETFRSVYFDKQNVKLDVNRFRPTLQKALELLHQ